MHRTLRWGRGGKRRPLSCATYLPSWAPLPLWLRPFSLSSLSLSGRPAACRLSLPAGVLERPASPSIHRRLRARAAQSLSPAAKVLSWPWEKWQRSPAAQPDPGFFDGLKFLHRTGKLRTGWCGMPRSSTVLHEYFKKGGEREEEGREGGGGIGVVGIKSDKRKENSEIKPHKAPTPHSPFYKNKTHGCGSLVLASW